MKPITILACIILSHKCFCQSENFSLGFNYKMGFTKSFNDTLEQDKHAFISNISVCIRKNLFRNFHFETGIAFDTYGVSTIANLYNSFGQNIGQARANEVYRFASIPLNAGFIFNRFHLFGGTRASFFVQRKFSVGGLVVAKDKQYMNGILKMALNLKVGCSLINKSCSKLMLETYYNWLPSENFYSFGISVNFSYVFSYNYSDKAEP